MGSALVRGLNDFDACSKYSKNENDSSALMSSYIVFKIQQKCRHYFNRELEVNQVTLLHL
ncbi:hypothetical protein V1478_010763 [Vespula squamosa]|uniref:Uncharacterized protein n=1 Tax=Vespula squamosa TaxID=30214 RepID=A0ABD2AFX8_VESSQ